MNKIKAAFHKDVNNLIEGFAKHQKTDFALFCAEWKKRKFQHIYSSLVNDGEIICATADFLLVVKEVLISYRPFLEHLGALYLLYALYNKQPTLEYCKIRVTRGDWIRVKNLVACFDERNDADQGKLIFWKLVQGSAFRFVELDEEHGCDIHTHQAKRHFSTNPKVQTIFHNDMMSLQHDTAGLLPAMELLQGGYNEMKEIMQKDPDPSYQVLEKTTICQDIKKHLTNLKKIMEDPDKSSETVDESENETDIHARRQRLKHKAIQKRYSTSKKDDNVEVEDFHVTIKGDFIEIRNERKTTGTLGKMPRGTDVFAEPLPQETLDELEIPEE